MLILVLLDCVAIRLAPLSIYKKAYDDQKDNRYDTTNRTPNDGTGGT